MKRLGNPVCFCLLLAMYAVCCLDAGEPPAKEAKEEKSIASAIQEMRANVLEPGAFPTVFTDVCKRASVQELDALRQLLIELPQGHDDFNESFTAYAKARFRVALEKLKRAPIKVIFPKPAKEPPKYLTALPKEFTEAWQLQRSVMAPYRSLQEGSEKVEGDASNPPRSLEQSIRRFLAEPRSGAWKELFQHKSDGFLLLDGPRDMGILLSLLAEEKWAEAVGALLAYAPNTDPQDVDISDVVRDFLSACGVDWELAYLGATLPEEGENLSDASELLLRSRRNTDNAAVKWFHLATYGSPKTVELCLTLFATREWTMKTHFDS